MFRYLVFVYGDYYPAGGMSDCILKTNSLKEAETKVGESSPSDTREIYDTKEDVTIDFI